MTEPDQLAQLRAQLAEHITNGDTQAAGQVRAQLDQLRRPARETAVRHPDETR